MLYGSYSAELTGPMQTDQMFGSMLVLAGLMLWIGRQHWAMILRAMFAARRDDDDRGSYLPYWLAGWGLVVCCVLQMAWLVTAGTTCLGAFVIVLMMLLLLMMVSRVAAETGLYYVQLNVPAWRPWIFALPHRTSAGTFFWSTFMSAAFTHDTRECASVYTVHALRVADDAGVSSKNPRRQAVGFIMALMLSMVLAFAVGGASYLKMDYENAIMLGGHSQTAPNSYAVDNMALNQVAEPMQSYLPPREGMVEMHSRAGHFTFGAGLTAVLGVLRLRYEGFPFHPLGFLLAYTFPIARMWFSIFLGWLLKSLIMRYGGATLFKSIKPMFIGLVVGESLAAALWLVITLGLAWAGQPYFRVYFTP